MVSDRHLVLNGEFFYNASVRRRNQRADRECHVIGQSVVQLVTAFFQLHRFSFTGEDRS